MLPDFDSDGMLPAGIYDLTLDELRRSSLVIGPRNPRPSWDVVWRSHLVDNLEKLVHQLWRVGISEIVIGGSFAEDKDKPGDIDGYFPYSLAKFVRGDLEARLNALDLFRVWTWDELSCIPDADRIPRLPMWHRYRVELFPDYGQPTGLVDDHKRSLDFPSALRLSRNSWKPRGVIRIRRP